MRVCCNINDNHAILSFKSPAGFTDRMALDNLANDKSATVILAARHFGSTTLWQHDILAAQHFGTFYFFDTTTFWQHNILALPHFASQTFCHSDIVAPRHAATPNFRFYLNKYKHTYNYSHYSWDYRGVSGLKPPNVTLRTTVWHVGERSVSRWSARVPPQYPHC